MEHGSGLSSGGGWRTGRVRFVSGDRHPRGLRATKKAATNAKGRTQCGPEADDSQKIPTLLHSVCCASGQRELRRESCGGSLGSGQNGLTHRLENTGGSAGGERNPSGIGPQARPLLRISGIHSDVRSVGVVSPGDSFLGSAGRVATTSKRLPHVSTGALYIRLQRPRARCAMGVIPRFLSRSVLRPRSSSPGCRFG